MGYGNGTSYLDDWDAWDKHQALKNGDTTAYAGGGSVVEFKGKKNSDVHYQASGERCFQKHPALKLPGSELLIYGGSCSAPVVKDADVYIGFDEGSMRFTERSYPWKAGVEFLFKIGDMSTPEKPDEFKKLVSWTKTQLEAGKKVHCGCIGGHGRTGTFLAALCSEFGEKDAITYVRKKYCQKAVESSSQVSFLHEHFGITKVDGFKSSATYSTPSSKGGKASQVSQGSKSYSGHVDRFTPVPGNGCIWDAPVP